MYITLKLVSYKKTKVVHEMLHNFFKSFYVNTFQNYSQH